MPYDENLADRIRQLFPPEIEYTEKKMFGGLAFLINGNMSIAVSAKGGILVRVSPDKYETLSKKPNVEVAVMGARKMKGWLRVSSNNLKTKKQLKLWFDHCLSFVKTLPIKTK